MESLQPLPKWFLITFVAIALIGFADSAYLTAEHFRGSIPPCSVVEGCEQVLTSSYAVIAGIPVALLGMLYYAALLVGIIAYIDSRNPKVMSWIRWMTVGGFVMTLYFLFVQAFILKAFCQYCLLSAITSTALFVLAHKKS